jgi:hypothetical protein
MCGMWKRAMAERLRHRQTKGVETGTFNLQRPRHISTLPPADGDTNQMPNEECDTRRGIADRRLTEAEV